MAAKSKHKSTGQGRAAVLERATTIPRRGAKSVRAAPVARPTPSARSRSSKTAPSFKPTSKLAQLMTLLRRREGASLDALMKMTGWQAHSIRAALTGLRKKGTEITLAKHEGAPSTYHAV